jgi:BirA family biotin operon repressor/biotin-[acetyl-CoA-carboxylase] ligase
MNDNSFFDGLPVRLIRLDSTPSTSSVVKAAAIDGKPEGLLVIADAQTDGRGQRGRSFYSPPDCGVYFSLLLRPKFKPAQAEYITTAAAVAVCNAIELVAGVPSGIKWVNDIICNDRKVAGILTEAAVSSDGGPYYVNLGIGVNITEPDGGFPPEISSTAGAVLPFGDVKRLRLPLVAAFARNFFAMYANLESKTYADEYKSRSVLTGRKIRLSSGSETLTATVTGIDDNIRLLVRDVSGEERAISSGRYRIEIL